MKKLKSQVPESLVGVFGIDFLGSVTRSIATPVYIVLGIIAIGLGVWLGSYLPSTEIQGAEGAKYWFESLQFTWIPVVAALMVGKLFSSFIAQTLTAVKVIYFTVFYTKISHPESIKPELPSDRVDYLKLEGVDAVADKENQITGEDANVKSCFGCSTFLLYFCCNLCIFSDSNNCARSSIPNSREASDLRSEYWFSQETKTGSKIFYAPVAQLDRASDFGSEG